MEDDRDHYKKEMEELQKLIHKRFISKDDTAANSKVLLACFSIIYFLFDFFFIFTLLIFFFFIQEEKNAITQLMKEERDFYKKEYELLQSSKSSRLHSPLAGEKVSFVAHVGYYVIFI